MNMKAPASAFQSAVDNFKASARLTPKEMQDVESTTLADLRQTIARIQTEQKVSRKAQALRRIEPFVRNMERYGRIIDLFVNVNSFVAFIWGPIKFLLQVTSQFSEAFSMLLEGYFDISLCLPHLAQYEYLFGQNASMQEALALMYTDILQFHLVAVNYFKQKVWKQMFGALGTGLKSQIDNLGKLLQAHKKFIESEASINHFRELQSFRAEENMRFQREKQEIQDRRRARVHDWLGALQPEKPYEDAKRRSYPGTGQWIFSNDTFKRWYNLTRCADALLWLNGMPGAGKTVLASTIIKEARRLSGVTVIFVYCNSNNDNTQVSGLLGVAKSMLSQLLYVNDDIVDYLYSERRHAELHDVSKACELLRTALMTVENVYLVIDGLDEFPRQDRKDISTWFIDLIRSVPKMDFGSLRCLFVSQDDGAARKDLGALATIRMTAVHNCSDIEAFCRARHREIEDKLGPLVGDEHNVAKIVSLRAKVTANLLAQYRRVDLEAELQPNVLPSGIDEAYERIIRRILPESSRGSTKHVVVLKLLAWITCAKRPLKWYEIQGAMAVDLEEVDIRPEYMFEEDCKEVCASIVDVASDQTVTLVHQTAKLYLINNDYVKELEAHINLATLTLAYLAFPIFDIEEEDVDINKEIWRGNYAFYDYSVCSWGLHLESGIKGSATAPADKIEALKDYLKVFLDFHANSPERVGEINETTKRCLEPMRDFECFDNLCLAFQEFKNHLKHTSKPKPELETLRLPKVTLEVRKALEALSTHDARFAERGEELIKKYYGNNLFKCPRMSCQFFHRGFNSKEKRNQHVEKHDRSFLCPYEEEGCDRAIFGYTRAKDLEEHVIECHGVRKVVTDTTEFPADEASTTLLRKRDFVCETCQKAFPRKHNLKMHRVIHTGEKPYKCVVKGCEQTFARQHDCLRHERGHYDYEGLICCGETADGDEWGCKKRFAKIEALEKHLRSPAGQEHILPLVESYERKRLLDSERLSSSSSSASGSRERESGGEPPPKRVKTAVAVLGENQQFHIAVLERFPEIVGVRTN